MKRIHVFMVFAILAISAAAFAAPQATPPATTQSTTDSTTTGHVVPNPPPQPIHRQTGTKPPPPLPSGSTTVTSTSGGSATSGTGTMRRTTTTRRATTTRRTTTTRGTTATIDRVRSDATRANALLYDLINNNANLSHGAWVSTYNEIQMLTNRIYARVRSIHKSGAAVTHAREARTAVRQMHKDLAGKDPADAKTAAREVLTHLNEMLDALK